MIDKIINRIIGLLIKNRPNWLEYLCEKIFWQFKYIPQCFSSKQNFEKWESLGWHVTQAYFYSPIPELLKLNEKIWKEKSDLLEIDFNREDQVKFLKQIVEKYKFEFNKLPYNEESSEDVFYINNGNFTVVDSEIYYSIIRNFKPEKILEIGSGFSSFLSYKALKLNNSGELICIEPYPRDFFIKNISQDVVVIEEKMQDIQIDFFTQLKENDILFIDSSHVLKLGSDVHYLFFNLLPKLKKGVLIHFHDIFLPFHYPEIWNKENRYFWNEQYILQAFLMYNTDYKMIISNSMINNWEKEYLKQNLNSYRNDNENPGSIWFQKVK